MKETQGLDEIVPLALKNLPEKVALSPRLYCVMGGRAGASAIGDAIYIDLLSDAWRTREKNTPMTPQQIVEFFAHETHHLGYGHILERRKQSLRLTGGREQAWNFLASLLMEGSATLLVSAHGNWAELEKQDHIQPDLSRLQQLLPKAQSVLRQTLNGRMSEQEHQAAVSDFFGEGYHATGAWMLNVILEAQGKRGVFRVMRDPGKFLTVYNLCAAKLDQRFRFDLRLAKDCNTWITPGNASRHQVPVWLGDAGRPGVNAETWAPATRPALGPSGRFAHPARRARYFEYRSPA